MAAGTVKLVILVVIICPCTSTNIFQFLGRSYREHLIRFREDGQFGNKPILDEYDFVVVGAGAAGATVARRLAEVSEWRILLLEAGGEQSLVTSLVPAFAPYWQFTDYNWNYGTENETRACKGLIGKRCPLPTGKGLGGGTIINNNIYARGNVGDFDGWAELGNEGWSYDDVLPYFLKNEDVNVPELKRSPHHGVGGPMSVSYPVIKSKLLDAFLESAPEVGMRVGDYNAPGHHVVFSRIQSTTLGGRRVTSAQAYLWDDLPNLHVVEFGHVTKVLIDESTRSAYGVEFVKSKRKRKVRAKREVILSAGTFDSAKILMLSGVGPKEHLEPMGIKTISDLRVGDNLQEHPVFAGLSFVVNQTVGFVPDRIFRNYLSEIFKLALRGSFLSLLPPEGIGFVKTKYNDKSGDVPDLEYLFVPVGYASDGGLGRNLARISMGVPDKLFHETYGDILNKDAWNIWIMLLYPESRGQVCYDTAE